MVYLPVGNIILVVLATAPTGSKNKGEVESAGPPLAFQFWRETWKRKNGVLV